MFLNCAGLFWLHDRVFMIAGRSVEPFNLCQLGVSLSRRASILYRLVGLMSTM